MKSIQIVLLFSLLAIAATSSAATLNCWNTYDGAKVVQPYMTAIISASNKLSHIQFNNKDYDNIMDSSSAPQVEGTLIANRRSPYDGYNAFVLDHNSQLIMPTDLTAANLADIGQGFFSDYDKLGGGVNAIIIGYNQGESEGGDHYSIRLHCQSDL